MLKMQQNREAFLCDKVYFRIGFPPLDCCLRKTGHLGSLDSHHLGGDELQQNKLSAVEDGKRFHWFHPSSNPYCDSNLKDVASILMISLVLEPHLVAVRKSRLPSELNLSPKSCCWLLRGCSGKDQTWWQGQDKVAFCVICVKKRLSGALRGREEFCGQYSI